MTHTYSIEGMSCQSCAAEVEEAISRVSGVNEATVTLDPPRAVVHSERSLPLHELRQAVAGAGEYRIEPADEEDGSGSDSGAARFSLALYKPLLLIAGYITIVSGVVAFAGGQFEAGLFFRSFMAGFFLAFSFFKLLDLKGFADAYAGYDLLARRWPTYGYLYGFLEFGLGISYLAGAFGLLLHVATISLMGFSLLGVVRVLWRGESIRCACLGTLFELPMSRVTLFEDLTMVLMAAAMLAVELWI